MAWAVRAAQLSQHRTLVGMLAATLSCAAIFLGVKTVEYTHKWDLGLLTAANYVSQVPTHHVEHSTFWLRILCTPAAIIFVCSFAWYLYAWLQKSPFQREVAGPVLVAAACFFGGVILGQKLTAGEQASHDSHAVASADGHGHDEHAEHTTADSHAHGKTADVAAGEQVMTKQVDSYTDSPMYVSQAFPKEVRVNVAAADVPLPEVNQKSMAGVFFSIYYAMTGVHAVHILAGMLVLTWMIVKGARKEFHSQYFGPVDNVGLYWHLVDFIWIYLFPLLYLIT